VVKHIVINLIMVVKNYLKVIKYREYDINEYTKGHNTGTERIVIGDDTTVWYTNDHYQTFNRIK
jgi:guanyl-specific ribonuclease Sa